MGALSWLPPHARPHSPCGYVYAVIWEERVKIGWSKDPARRAAELRKSYPGACLVAIAAGSRRDEAAVHAEHGSRWIEREWFKIGAPFDAFAKRAGCALPAVTPAVPLPRLDARGGAFVARGLVFVRVRIAAGKRLTRRAAWLTTDPGHGGPLCACAACLRAMSLQRLIVRFANAGATPGHVLRLAEFGSRVDDERFRAASRAVDAFCAGRCALADLGTVDG